MRAFAVHTTFMKEATFYFILISRNCFKIWFLFVLGPLYPLRYSTTIFFRKAAPKTAQIPISSKFRLSPTSKQTPTCVRLSTSPHVRLAIVDVPLTTSGFHLDEKGMKPKTFPGLMKATAKYMHTFTVASTHPPIATTRYGRRHERRPREERGTGKQRVEFLINDSP